MLHNFAWYGGRGSAAGLLSADDFATPGLTTCLSAAKEEEWAMDEEALSVVTTDCRRLSCMPIESLVVAGVGTAMVLLVRADNNKIVMGGKAHRVEERQRHSQTFISRKDFITLQCHISECRQGQVVVSGVVSGQYKDNNFVRYFQGGNVGFAVQFSGRTIDSITWKEVASNPQTFIFFGPPTSP